MPRVAAASYNCICFDYVECCRPKVVCCSFQFSMSKFEGSYARARFQHRNDTSHRLLMSSGIH